MSRRKGQRKKAQQRKKHSSGGQQVPRRKRDGSAAIRGMLVGGAIVLALAVFFFVRVGGETGFNHLVGLFVTEEADDSEGNKGDAQTTPGSSPLKTPPPQTIRLNGPQGQPSPLPPNVRFKNLGSTQGEPTTPTTNFDKATPMEATTDDDQRQLENTLRDLAR